VFRRVSTAPYVQPNIQQYLNTLGIGAVVYVKTLRIILNEKLNSVPPISPNFLSSLVWVRVTNLFPLIWHLMLPLSSHCAPGILPSISSVLLGSPKLSHCAPGVTHAISLCTWGRPYYLIVLLGSPVLSHCAPGVTRSISLCPWGLPCYLIVLLGSPLLSHCAPGVAPTISFVLLGSPLLSHCAPGVTPSISLCSWWCLFYLLCTWGRPFHLLCSSWPLLSPCASGSPLCTSAPQNPLSCRRNVF
jgi:hypothetical protein